MVAMYIFLLKNQVVLYYKDKNSYSKKVQTIVTSNNIFHSQDLLSRDVLLMFPKLIGIIIICDFCIMGIPWDVP